MTSLLADADEIRLLQESVHAGAVRDLGELFDVVRGLDPEPARDLLISTLPEVVQTYGDVNATAAGEWFERLRERQVGSGFQAVLAPSVEFTVVEQGIRFSAQHLFVDQVDQMEKYLVGQVIKWVNQPSQETIIRSIDADPIGFGWQRVVRPGGCGFCRMLADRGGVYTRKSVWFASHANCNCGAVPSWDPDLPEVDVKAYEMSKRTASLKRRAAGEGFPDDWSDAKKAAKQAQAQRVLDDHRARTKAWLKDMPD